MQTEITIMATSLRLVILLMLLLLMWQFVFYPSLVALFEQDVINIKRKLYLFMASGRVAHDSDVYRDMSKTMDGVLRFSGGMTFMRVAFWYLLSKSQKNEASEEVFKELDKVQNVEARSELCDLRRQLFVAMYRHLWRVSFLWMIIALPIIKWTHYKRMATRKFDIVVRSIREEYSGWEAVALQSPSRQTV